MQSSLPLRICGTGRYLPKRLVTNDEIEAVCQLPKGWCFSTLGMMKRYWAQEENQPYMGAMAAQEAVTDAGLDFYDIDLMINASTTFAHIIPDDSPYIKKELGLEESGLPCVTIQEGALSFLVALEISGVLIAAGRCRNILIISSEAFSPILDPRYPEPYALFGDGAAAVVLTNAMEEEKSSLDKAVFQCFNNGKSPFQSVYGLKALRDWEKFQKGLGLELELKPFINYGLHYLIDLIRNLYVESNSMKEPLIIPLQMGTFLQDSIKLNLPSPRMFWNYRDIGFCGAASYPLALHEAIKTNQLQRNEMFLMAGFDSGSSVGGVIGVY